MGMLHIVMISESFFTPFRIRYKLDAKLQTQGPTNVLIHYGDKLNSLVGDLQRKRLINQIGSMPHGKPNYRTTFMNPLNIIKNNNSIKNVLDTRHFCSETDQSFKSWPLAPLPTQLVGANKVINLQ